MKTTLNEKRTELVITEATFKDIGTILQEIVPLLTYHFSNKINTEEDNGMYTKDALSFKIILEPKNETQFVIKGNDLVGVIKNNKTEVLLKDHHHQDQR